MSNEQGDERGGNKHGLDHSHTETMEAQDALKDSSLPASSGRASRWGSTRPRFRSIHFMNGHCKPGQPAEDSNVQTSSAQPHLAPPSSVSPPTRACVESPRSGPALPQLGNHTTGPRVPQFHTVALTGSVRHLLLPTWNHTRRSHPPLVQHLASGSTGCSGRRVRAPPALQR